MIYIKIKSSYVKIGITHEENYEENMEQDFEDNFEENFEEKFEENHEENLEQNVEASYFEKTLKLNRRYQINFEKVDNDHNDDNRPSLEPSAPNSDLLGKF